jgi:uncharacterized Zn-binding protein involved in type VI secretion
MSGHPAARVGDNHSCPATTPTPHVGGPVTPPGAVTVRIGMQSAARVTDKATCTGPLDIVLSGALTVFTKGLFAARQTDACGHGGVVVGGLDSVQIGGPTGTVTVHDDGTITLEMGGMVVNGTPEDVAEWMRILSRECLNSPSFHQAIQDMVADTAHPTTFNVGRDNAYWVDSFATNNVDLNDLQWYDEDPNPDYPWAETQGEVVSHFIDERRHHETTGDSFGDSHDHATDPGSLQHNYRQDRGQPGRTVSQVRHDDPNDPNRHEGRYTDDSGNSLIIRRDTSSGQPVPYEREYRPANPTSSAPGATYDTPP